MGGGWVERHMPQLFKHILELVSHAKTTAVHIDAVYSRKCVGFILRQVFGRLLGESSQLAAVRQLAGIVTQTITLIKGAISNPSLRPPKSDDKSSEGSDKEKDKASQQQHAVICAIIEIGALVYNLNTAALPLVIGDNVGVVSALDLVKKPPVLLSALTSVLSLPYLAARLAGAWCMRCIGLALPSQLSTLLDYNMSLLRGSVGQSDLLSGYSAAVAGLLGSVRYCELGLPSSQTKEVLSLGQELVEKGKSESYLISVQSGWSLIGAFVSLGPVYVRSQLRQLLTLWRSCFPRSSKEMNTELLGGNLRSWTITLENRTGALSSIGSFINFCADLLTPELVKRLMLPLDSALAMLSGLAGLAKVHGVQIKACGAMLRLRLYQALAQLPPSAYEGSLNALLKELVTEFTLSNSLANTSTSHLRSMVHHDDSILLGSWLEDTDHQPVEEQLQANSAAGSGALEHDHTSLYMADNKGTELPDPLPLGVAVIDSAIVLFGKTFPAVAVKHRQQLLTHFKDCIRQAKSGRQDIIQINIFTAFLAALRNLVDSKSVLGQQDLLGIAYELITGALASGEPMLRCAAGEALGRMSQVGGDTAFVAQIAQKSFDSLKSQRDVVSRTGHSLVLGCLHRYVGGMGSGQHLQQSVSILHSLTRDVASPTVQVWALHALALIADSGGPMFRNYVEHTLALMLSLLVSTPASLVEVYQCLAKCLSALITTLGPELQDTSQSMNTTRKTCLTCCEIVQEHPDAIVQSAAIGCLQQLQLFAPQFVTLPVLVPSLYSNLYSPHLLLRRAAANCLRQFTQREPKLVWGIPPAGSSGLENIVLARLDMETDPKLREDLEEILFSLLTSLAPEDPTKWLTVCNQVLSAATDKPGLSEASGDQKEIEEEEGKFTTGESEELSRATRVSPRWPTRVFAVDCTRKIYSVCRSDSAHFNLVTAQQRKRERNGDYLVMHLSELVRTSFIAATASVDHLRLAGYKALRDVIELFAGTADPDLPGHLLLEQYQAQIGAALRPAFTKETAPHVTAMACMVCSEWLGSGVSRDIGDLKRVQQLLVNSLDKLGSGHSEGYGESVATMEGLAVLKAWAELYIKVTEDSEGGGMELLTPHLDNLSSYWLAALKDHAHLSLPSVFNSQLPPNGGTFFTANVMDIVRPYYQSNWSSLLHSSAIWLNSNHKQGAENTANFNLVLGLAVQSLCYSGTLDQPLTLANCLKSLKILMASSTAYDQLSVSQSMPTELLSVLHRVLLTSQSKPMHILALQVSHDIGNALSKAYKSKPELLIDTPGPATSAYSLLKVSACCLFRLIPGLSSLGSHDPITALSADDLTVVSACLSMLVTSLSLCSAKGNLVILPPALHMLLSSIQSLAGASLGHGLQCLRELCSVLHLTDEELGDQVAGVLCSALCSVLGTEEGGLSYPRLSEETRLLVVAVFLLASERICSPGADQFAAAVALLKHTINSNNTKLQMRGIQICKSLFQKGVASFIHQLAPVIVSLVEGSMTQGETPVLVESTQALEILLDTSQEQHKHLLMGLLLPLYVSLLLEPAKLPTASKECRLKHEHLLKHVTLIGPKHPQAFRGVMSGNPGLNQRLKMAIQAGQLSHPTAASSASRQTQQAPAIKLKMDFSNFK